MDNRIVYQSFDYERLANYRLEYLAYVLDVVFYILCVMLLYGYYFMSAQMSILDQ